MAKNTFTPIINRGLQITHESLISPDDIARFQDRFEHLAFNDFPAAFQYAMVYTTREAQEGLADVMDETFESPVPYSRVNPNDLKHTSIRRWNAKVPVGHGFGRGEIESRVFVMRKQSAYFKYTLGERVRRPGDIGLDYIGTPIWDNLTELQGIKPTREGNLHKNAMPAVGQLLPAAAGRRSGDDLVMPSLRSHCRGGMRTGCGQIDRRHDYVADRFGPGRYCRRRGQAACERRLSFGWHDHVH